MAMGSRRLAFILLFVSVPIVAEQEPRLPFQCLRRQRNLPLRSPLPQQNKNIRARRPRSRHGFPSDLTPDSNGALSQQQMQQLFRVVADKDLENEKKLRDYTTSNAMSRTTSMAKGGPSPPK